MHRFIAACLAFGLCAVLVPCADAGSRRLAQASQPADENIANVIADLDRYETQAASMRPGASGAKRTLKLLGLSEQRLNASPNKSDPSWIAANERLQALKHRLSEIAAGRDPNAAPAAKAPAATAPAAPAASGPDPAIAEAQAELARIAAALEAMAPGDKTTGRQLVADMNRLAETLKAYPDRHDPNWTKLAQDYNALNPKIAAKANAPAPQAPAQAAPAPQPPTQAAPAPAAPAQPAAPSVSPASEQRVAAARRRLRELEVSAERVTRGMPQDAIAIVNQLQATASSLVPDEDQKHPKWQDFVGRYDKLRTAMLTLATDNLAQRLANQMATEARELDATDPLKVQEPEETKKWRATIASGRQQMAQLPDQSHPKVASAGRAIENLEKLLEQKLAYVPPEQPTGVALYNRELPDDRPVLIDSIGHMETQVLVQVHQGRPLTWVPEPIFFVRFPAHESDDAIVMQVLKDGAPLGHPMTCRSGYFAPEAALAYFSCRPPKEDGLVETGSFQLKVVYKQTLLEKSHDLALLRLDVRPLLHGSQNKPTPTYGDNFDMRMSVATIEENGVGPPEHRYSGSAGLPFHIYSEVGSAMDQADVIPNAVIRFWMKAEKNWAPTKISCFYKDKKVAEADGSGGGSGRGNWTYADGKRVNEYWDPIAFIIHGLKFRPQKNGERGSYARPVHFLNENPGEYRCVVTSQGEIVKELFFAVGADGQIEKPECQAQSMTALRHVTLLRQRNRKIATVPYDEAIGRELGYYGNVEWQAPCPLIE